MPRHFNTTGPCKPNLHYMLPPTDRLPNLERVVAQQNYLVIHAPRQTGKTTAMLALAKQLVATQRYAAVMVSVEVGQPFGSDVGQAELAILEAWRRACRVRLPIELQLPVGPPAAAGGSDSECAARVGDRGSIALSGAD